MNSLPIHTGDKMKVYISTEQPETSEYKHVPNIMSLDSVVLDSEATDIVVKNYLSQFADNELMPLLQKIVSKLRINGAITILDNDIDITYMKYDRGDIDLKMLNSIVFRGQSKKSFLNIETVKDLVKDVFTLEHSSVDAQTGNFIVKARRTANG